MADKFDRYREALVVEVDTVWPEEFEHLDAERKARISESLHSKPEAASELEYVRVHTGFCRKITVTADDVARIGA